MLIIGLVAVGLCWVRASLQGSERERKGLVKVTTIGHVDAA